jgi:glycerophosphoryl diester phosphodiesterase
VEENGKRYRAGMFGGAGINQIKISFLKRCGLSYFQRAQYLQSLARLRKEPVDIFLGNHSWNNKTPEKYQLSLTSQENPFIDSTGWGEFLDSCEKQLMDTMAQESKDGFINFAHRGASEYAPENTMMSFSLGMFQGANGIETDVQMTKDGVPVLFHDDSLERVTGQQGSIGDYTYEQLRQFDVKKGELTDKILKLEDFLIHFGFRDITFAIELKTADAAEATVALIRKYAMEKKVTVTSFKYDAILKVRAVAPELKTGLLTSRVDDTLLERMRLDGIDELCPKADLVTAEAVTRWHTMGFHVRAWGVKNEEVMKAVYDAGANGMTVNFPDKLKAYMSE